MLFLNGSGASLATMGVLLDPFAGRYDGIAPPANSDAIAAGIPGSDLRLYDGGHAFFVQDPRAFPDITAWLAA